MAPPASTEQSTTSRSTRYGIGETPTGSSRGRLVAVGLPAVGQLEADVGGGIFGKLPVVDGLTFSVRLQSVMVSPSSA